MEEILTCYEEYLSINKFIAEFVEKIVCVDPLDRKIFGGYDPEDSE